MWIEIDRSLSTNDLRQAQGTAGSGHRMFSDRAVFRDGKEIASCLAMTLLS